MQFRRSLGTYIPSFSSLFIKVWAGDRLRGIINKNNNIKMIIIKSKIRPVPTACFLEGLYFGGWRIDRALDVGYRHNGYNNISDIKTLCWKTVDLYPI